MKKNPEYQYIYQYNPEIGLFCSTFRSIFAISVHEVHISTNQYEWPPWKNTKTKELTLDLKMVNIHARASDKQLQ